MAIFHDVEQNTEAWHRLRMAIPTASNFSRIVTAKTMQLSESKATDLYLSELLACWALDRPITGPETDYMTEGHDAEDRAVDSFEFTTGLATSNGGFYTTDDGLVGASPDRSIEPDAVAEIKSHPGNPGIHLQYMRGTASFDPDHKMQLQGELWVTERKRVWAVSYCEGLPECIFPIDRDEEYISKLAAAVWAFVHRLMEARVALDAKYGIEQQIVERRKLRAEQQTDVGSLGIDEGDVELIWNYTQRENG